MKLLFIVISLIIFFTYSFFNLGYFLDTTETPTKADLIVCLGGGDYKKRVKKTLELLKENYLSSKTIIFTGEKEQKNIKDKFDDEFNVIFETNVTNTAQEVKYIKQYMIEHSLSSVLILVATPQSRRVSILNNIINIKNDENLSIKIIANDSTIWDSKYYYKNDSNRKYAFAEVIKIIYNTFIYGLIDSIGLLDTYYIYFYDYVKNHKNIAFAF